MEAAVKKITVIALLITTITWPIYAYAFGTVRHLGQSSEHEKITRQAFSCEMNVNVGFCFQKKTLNKLAGKNFTFGGVGYPDKNQKLFKQDTAHCDNGDFLNTPEAPGLEYAQTASQAESKIKACRKWMQNNFDKAIVEAFNMLNDDGSLNSRAVKRKRNCIKSEGRKNSAKCKVLSHFGFTLHAAQDFYAHSNWVDTSSDTTSKISTRNPPGLMNRGPSPWLRMAVSGNDSLDTTFPAGLISGCYQGIRENKWCFGTNDKERIKHKFLNKDKGKIGKPNSIGDEVNFPDVGYIGHGKDERGKEHKNFEHAVYAAILDSRSKLKQFKTALDNKVLSSEGKYTKAHSDLIFCALTHDKPIKDC